MESQKKIQLPVQEFLGSINQWQTEIFRAFDDDIARFFLLCWHRRARKTTFGINLLIREAAKHPKEVYGYIGPTYTQAKAIIWRDPNMLFKYIPQEIIKKRNESELYVELINGSMIVIKGADNPDAIRGQDYRGVVLDEWALMKSMVWEEILRPIITQSRDRWAMFSFTPKGRNFVYDYWLRADNWPDWYKSFLTVENTGIIPKEELEKAKKEVPASLYGQEFECSFLADDEGTLIASQNVEDLSKIKIIPRQLKKVISCDPSQGGDECVILAFENSIIKESMILHEEDTMKIAGYVASMMSRHKTEYAAIDEIGIGAGICDRLREMGKKVIGICSSERSSKEDLFYNRRAEMWWYTMEQIRDKKVDYPADPEIRRELSFVKYQVVDSNGKIKLEPKKDTKERLGRSPDRADAFVYGIWALKNIEPIQKDSWQDEIETAEIGVGISGAMAA